MKSKRILILAICAGILFVGLCAALYIPLEINNRAVDQRVSTFLEPYRTAAVEYVATNEDAIARFGQDVLSKCTVGSFTYRYATDQYKSFFFFSKAPETEDEFNENIEYIEVSVRIGKSDDAIVDKATDAKCVVRFEKDETGKMTIVGHEWEN